MASRTRGGAAKPPAAVRKPAADDKPAATDKPVAAKRSAPRITHRAIHRYGSVYAAAGTGIVVAVLAVAVRREFTLELGAIGFFLTYLGSILAKLPRLTQAHLRAHSDESDLPGYVILLVALATLIASSISLLLLLNGGSAPDRLHVALGIVATVLGWLTIHAMLAFHYAYEYYETDAASPVGKDGRRGHVGGLDFPGRDAPDALSFLYFSFVIAMTAQVSDVTVTSNGMRRLVLLHGIMSFFFNTVIVAIAVNIVVSLGH